MTNLQSIQKATLHLFDTIPLMPLNGLNIGAACHPFTNSIFYYNHNSGKWLDISLPNGYTAFRNHIENTIKSSSLPSIYSLIHESYKLTWFQLCKDFMDSRDFALYLKSCWLDEDDPNQDRTVRREEVIDYFQQADKMHLMHPADLSIFQQLPDTLTIYRGVSPHRARLGLSWTADKNMALWYKKRYEGLRNGQLLTATISKEHILAYIDDLNEKELIVDVFSIQSQIQEL